MGNTNTRACINGHVIEGYTIEKAMAVDICNSERNRQNLLAAVAHDFKNPLVVIGAAARRLKRKVSASEEQSVWLDHIIDRVSYLENLVYDLLESVQIETCTMSLDLTELELTSFIRGIHRIQSELITTHRIIFKGEGECWVKGDVRRLERVILNLLSNAVKTAPRIPPCSWRWEDATRTR